nr:RNA-directed DNA polymerase, eukaryota [Tanacetum cinerariifolium]
MGDFNEVRDISERFRSIFNKHGVEAFNSFIVNASLVKVPLGGCSFTWCHKSAKKMSKLDRFLIYDNLMCSLPSISYTSLDRFLSYHRSIIMREAHFDYGPIPFMFFHYWFELDDFDKMMIWKRRCLTRRLKGRFRIVVLIKHPGQMVLHLVSIDDIGTLLVTMLLMLSNGFFCLERSRKEVTRLFITLIPKVLANRLVTVLDYIVDEIQSAFETDRQILDGPFILNDILYWCKNKKKQYMIFKVDFEKAYDSVRRDFIDDILWRFSFREKWYKWIQSCLYSSRGSVLVNESPTKEFQFHKGLKQGDSLSLFLFILVMESLHVSFQRVVDAGLFNRIKLDLSLHISHLFYDDDAIFMGQWNQCNIDTIIQVLDVFYCASGLRINMNKNNLMGISVDSNKVKHAAAKIGCLVLKTPFNYLGSRVGDLMSRIQSWHDVTEGMHTRLSKWKLKTLSIEGASKYGIYLCAFFNGADVNSKKPSWVRWKSFLAAKDVVGLRTSRLFALNRTLMFKWVWRFFNQKNSLWVRVVKALHGEDGKIG